MRKTKKTDVELATRGNLRQALVEFSAACPEASVLSIAHDPGCPLCPSDAEVVASRPFSDNDLCTCEIVCLQVSGPLPKGHFR